jgi:hypothetical protein
MKVAFGFKTHSGWAALVVLSQDGDDLMVIDRRRVELVEELWAKQPYHAAEQLERHAARDLVRRGVEMVQRVAFSEMKAAIKRERDRKNEVTSCSVLVGAPMPGWNTDEILAVHFRMHKAEGVLFQNALVQAAERCKLKTLPVFEKELLEQASKRLGTPADLLVKQIAGLRKSAGAPWGKDQKDAALVALMALHA